MCTRTMGTCIRGQPRHCLRAVLSTHLHPVNVDRPGVAHTHNLTHICTHTHTHTHTHTLALPRLGWQTSTGQAQSQEKRRWLLSVCSQIKVNGRPVCVCVYISLLQYV